MVPQGRGTRARAGPREAGRLRTLLEVQETSNQRRITVASEQGHGFRIDRLMGEASGLAT